MYHTRFQRLAEKMLLCRFQSNFQYVAEHDSFRVNYCTVRPGVVNCQTLLVLKHRPIFSSSGIPYKAHSLEFQMILIEFEHGSGTVSVDLVHANFCFLAVVE
jgi:hypothetical protein